MNLVLAAQPKPTATSAPAKGDRWIPWTFVFGFLVIIIANGALIWFALTTFGGLYVQRPYSDGLDFNQALARAESSASLGWSMEFARDGDSVIVRLTNEEDRGLEGLALRATLVQPIADAQSQALDFVPMGAGRYRCETGPLAPGRWELRVVAERGQDRFAAVTRFLVSP